jgi:uncharacterized protein
MPMTSFRNRLESLFARAAETCYRHRFKTLAVTLAIFLALASQAGKLTIATSTESFFHEDDPAIVAYNAFRDQFGRDDVIVLAVRPDRLFATRTLETLRAFHREIEETVPHIEDVTSLVNIRSIRGNGDELIVEDLLEDWPATARAMAALQQRVMTDPFYKNIIVSEDAALTTVIVQFKTYAGSEMDSDAVLAGFDDDPGQGNPGADPGGNREFLGDAQISETVDALAEVVARHHTPDFQIYPAGAPIVDNAAKRSISRDMGIFASLSLVVIIAFLYLMFKRISGVIIPLVIVIMSMLSTLGIMGLMGAPITLVTQILSSFILVVSVGDAVHILAVFYMQLDKTGDRQKAIGRAMGHSGLAVAMTSLTTAGGLLSFATADISPVADLGVYASLGVAAAFVYTVAMLPALVALYPLRPRGATGKNSGTMDRFLHRVADISVARPATIVAVSAVLFLGAAMGLTRLTFSHNILRWLPNDSPAVEATKLVDRELRGSVSLEMVIDTGKPGGIYAPRLLAGLDDSARVLEGIREGEVFAGKAWTVTSILKDVHKALNENRQAFYAVPSDPELIAQEFLLFENSGADDLEDVMDRSAAKVRFTIKSPFGDAVDYSRLIHRVRAHFNERYPGVPVTVTGIMALFTQTIHHVMTSMARSYLIAFVVISVLMAVFIGRLRIAALAMIPNLGPILLIIGFMGWTDLSLNASNMLVGSIAIGLVVDDTIHFMHNFSRYYQQTGNVAESVRKTLQTAGRAILVTSLVLTSGFLVYTLSSMTNIFQFGLLTAAAILLALAADFFLAPALMVLAFGQKGSEKKRAGSSCTP